MSPYPVTKVSWKIAKIFNKMLGVCPILGCFGTARAQKQSNDTYGVSDSLVLVSYSSRTLLVLARTWVQMSESQ